MKKPTYLWIGTALLLLVIFGTIYVAIQQTQRNDADYPQIQMAEDAAAALDKGVSSTMLTGGSVVMETSLAPFTVIYNADGKPISGTGYLRGELPTIPTGVLLAARGHEYHRVTWQPTNGVRIAAVAVAAHSTT
jgi:hypothetical protein